MKNQYVFENFGVYVLDTFRIPFQSARNTKHKQTFVRQQLMSLLHININWIWMLLWMLCIVHSMTMRTTTTSYVAREWILIKEKWKEQWRKVLLKSNGDRICCKCLHWTSIALFLFYSCARCLSWNFMKFLNWAECSIHLQSKDTHFIRNIHSLSQYYFFHFIFSILEHSTQMWDIDRININNWTELNWAEVGVEVECNFNWTSHIVNIDLINFV